MKVWITKYALTQGIFVKEAFDTSSDRMIGYQDGSCRSYIHKPDWHTSEAEVLAHAEEMRTKKLRSLEKQIAKLQQLRFGENS